MSGYETKPEELRDYFFKQSSLKVPVQVTLDLSLYTPEVRTTLVNRQFTSLPELGKYIAAHTHRVNPTIQTIPAEKAPPHITQVIGASLLAIIGGSRAHSRFSG